MYDTFYSPVITLGGPLGSMRKHKTVGIFQFIRVNRAAIMRHLLGM